MRAVAEEGAARHAASRAAHQWRHRSPLARRLLLIACRIPVTMLSACVVGFVLLKLAPGDAADVIASMGDGVSADSLAQFRAHYGLDQSVVVQFLSYLAALARGHLGWSVRFDESVATLIGDRIGATFLLTATALVLATLIGVGLGMAMAATAHRLPDRLLSAILSAIHAMPAFWISLMLIVLFSVKLGWLPSSGAETIGRPLAGLARLADRARHLALPAVSLALFYIVIYARVARAALIEAQAQDYARTARAKGTGRLGVMIHHVLPNALLPLTTVGGLYVGSMLGGAVVIETVYNWPGLGRLAYEAVMGRDFVLLLGILLLSSALVVVANTAVDLLHVLIDPRLRER